MNRSSKMKKIHENVRNLKMTQKNQKKIFEPKVQKAKKNSEKCESKFKKSKKNF